MKSLHRAVRITITITSTLFVLLILYFSYLIVFKGKEWKNDIHNLHALKSSASPGQILDREGVVLAGNNGTLRTYREDKTQRYAFAHITGDYDGIVSNSIEGRYMNELYALRNSWLGVNQLDNRQGDNIYTTIDYDLQLYAYQLLMEKGGRGAAVVLNYQTGEVLTMASAPSFDPEAPSKLEVEDGNYNNRCLSLFTPGSTVKVATLLAALKNDPSLLPTDFVCEGYSDIPGVDLKCNAKHGLLRDYEEALAVSCNVYYGKVAVLLGQKLQNTATDLYFNRSFSLERLTVSSSSLTVGDKSTQDVYSTGFGQSDVMASPLHLALLCGAVANDGIMVQPKIIKAMEHPDGKVKEKDDVDTLALPFKPDIAEKAMSAMRAVIRDNYSKSAGSSRFNIYGKSGTAERDAGSHAWFMGFVTPEDAGPYACCVLLENFGGSGGSNAGPIMRSLLTMAVDKGL